MTTAEIKSMDQAERLRLMEELWDAICHDVAEPPSPAWHSEILAERRKKIESGEAEFLTIDEAWNSLRK
ncbi:addiction module protein [Cerasicoccus fimbriatus]|uniref:addiction module protein n=1 Tax=Cerasicoccus fimbriatus TaxID=3014554 RepID=UPI0022B5CB6B|nr:addiction module protein [Cerasicoccus sp. TK19100]